MAGLQDQLDADEPEDDGKALGQVVELVEKTRKQEVQRAKTEDGKGVRRVDDERVVADRQHCGHAVDGEDEVCRLDRDHDREQRGRDALTGFLDEELRPVVLVANRNDLAEQTDRNRGARIVRIVLVLHQLPRAVEQNCGEDEENGGELADDGHARGKENPSEDQRADNTEEQHAVLILARHLEVSEDQGEHEEVVDGQTLLEQPGRCVFDTSRRTERGEDDSAEDDGDADP